MMKPFILFLLLISTISCESDKATEDFVLNTNTEIINLLHEDIDYIVDDFNRSLYDLSKTKYRSLQQLVTEIDLALFRNDERNMNKLLQEPGTMKMFYEALQYLKNEVPNKVVSYLDSNYEAIGLNEEYYGIYIEKIKQILDVGNVEVILSSLKDEENVDDQSQQAILMNLLQIKKKLLSELVILSGGKVISCWFGISPFLNPKQNVLRPGDKFKARITIIPYDFEFTPSELKIFIDNVEYAFEDRSYYIDYESEILYESKTIEIEGFHYNKLTSEFEDAWGEYEYRIEVIN